MVTETREILTVDRNLHPGNSFACIEITGTAQLELDMRGYESRLKVDPNEYCPVCKFVGDHRSGCPREPEEWRTYRHEISLVRDPSGCCIKCGKPIC